MATLAEVAADGDRRNTLRVLRDRLAEQIDTTASARDVAALSRQLTDVLSQIEAIEIRLAAEEVKEVDPVAELISLPTGDAVAG